MKKLFKILVAYTLCLSLILAVGCSTGTQGETSSGNGSENSQKPIQLRINFSQTEAHLAAGDPTSLGMKAMVDYLKDKGPDVFDVKVFYGNPLAAKIDETLPALQSGGFEMGGEAYGNLGGVTKAFMPLNFPFLLNTYEDAEKYWTGPVGQKMRADAEDDMDVKIIWSQYIGFRHITNSRAPIKTPSDMVGLKIRTMNDPYQVKAMESLGASPTPLAWSELFTALQQKVVDAQENPIMNIYNARMYEVQKYVTKTGHNFTWAGIFVSEKWFNSLPEDAKQLLVEAGQQAEKVTFEELKKTEARMEEELVSKFGMEIYEPTPDEIEQFRSLTMEVYSDIKKVIGDEYYDMIMKEMGIN